jgi:hypothetical protein
MTARIIDLCGGMSVFNTRSPRRDNERWVNGQRWVIHGEASFSHWNLGPGQAFDNPTMREQLQAILSDRKRRHPPLGLRWLYDHLARMERRQRIATELRQRAAERRVPRLQRMMEWK